jgi:hypothetical protein
MDAYSTLNVQCTRTALYALWQSVLLFEAFSKDFWRVGGRGICLKNPTDD